MKRKTIYMGGEADKQVEITPKLYEKFLRKKDLFGVLLILVAAAVITLIWI